MKCRACNAQLSPGAALCTRCKKWTFLPESKSVTHLSKGAARPPTPRLLSREWYAPLLGGGIVPGFVYLIGGEPGVGKSTAAAQMLNAAIGETDVDGLYIGVEEAQEELVDRGTRLGCAHIERFLVPNEKPDLQLGLLEDLPPVCMGIVDSLSRLARDERDAVYALERITLFAQRTRTAMIVLDHVTKGAEFSGFMALQHDVDCTIYLREDKKKKTRTWETIKNRKGPGHVSRMYTVTETGLIPYALPEDEDEEDDDPAPKPRARRTSGVAPRTGEPT